MTNIGGSDVSIKITATDETGQAINSAKSNLDGLGSHTGSVLDKMKSHWLAFTAAAAGALLALKGAWDMVDQYAKFEEQKASLNALAAQYGTSATQMIEKIREVTNGLISMQDAVMISGEAMQRGLMPDQIIQLAEAAETLSNISGSVSENFNSLSEAIATGRMRGLETKLGFIDLNEVLGKQVEKLTDAGKAHYMYEEVMKRVQKLQEQGIGTTESLNDRMDKLKITVSDLKLQLGNYLVKAGMAAMGILHELAAAGLMVAAGFLKVGQGLAWLIMQVDKSAGAKAAYESIKLDAEAMWNASKEAAVKGIDFFSSMVSQAEAANKAVGGLHNTSQKYFKEVEEKANTTNIKWLEGMMKEAAEAQKLIDTKMKKESEYYDYKMKLDEDFEALANQHMEEQARKEEELWRTQAKLYEDIKREQYASAWQAYFDMANSVGGELGQGFGMMGAGMKGMMDIKEGVDPYTEKMNQLAEYWDARLEYLRMVYASEEQMEAEHQAVMLQMEEATQQQKLLMASHMLNMMAGIFGSLAAMQDTSNKEGFERYKKLMYAQAVISTLAGMVRALAEYQYPYSLIVAGLVGIAGAIQIAKISNTQYGGGTTTTAMTTGGEGGGYSYSDPNVGTWENTEEKPQGKTIEVHIYGNVVDHAAFARELAPYIDEAKGDKVSYGD